jgi:4-hydroxyphenylpyruvate dioxygenase-like putative hemolysin
MVELVSIESVGSMSRKGSIVDIKSKKYQKRFDKSLNNSVDKQFLVVYPRTINHIAVSMTNLDKAVKWYQEVFGFNVINGPVEIVADDSSLGMVVKDIHGPNFKKMRVVWLSSGNQVGIEIFEYLDSRAER